MGWGNGDIDYWLGRKYALMGQQADAATMNAQTNQTTGAAQAALDLTKNALLPAESKASIAKSGAETNLVREQAKYLGPEALARIANTNADTKLTGTQEQVARRQGLTSIRELLGGYQLPTFSTDIATPSAPLARDFTLGSGGYASRRMSATELDRLNGFY